MNDFSYPPMPKDAGPKINLYPSESTPFARSNSFSRSHSFSQPQEYGSWRCNSTSSMAMPTVTETSSPASNSTDSTLTNNPATNPVSCDLQDVIVYYQSQPELLKLILMSKVEEDKRRTEEARLRTKQLDMLLTQQQQQLPQNTPQTLDASIMSPTSIINNSNALMSNANNTTHNYNNLLGISQFDQAPRRHSALEILMENPDCSRRDSSLGSSFDGSANSEELDDCVFSPNGTTTAATASMLSMNLSPQSTMPVTIQRSSSLHSISSPYNLTQSLQNNDSHRYHSYFPQRPRRRREMQAISKIVETREYPYVDGFFWKNNGNTVQKKTGNKSIYYKCSNSGKGCPVNKTVTWREKGEFLIKYRGEHLPECGKVQRIVDM